MCITAAIAAGVSLIASGVQAVSSIQGANANAALAIHGNQIRAKQLRDQAAVERLAAIQQENVRNDEFERARSSAFAALGASGVGENISFFQGVDPEQQRAYLRDVRSIRLNLLQGQVKNRDEIAVTGLQSDIARVNRTQTRIGAIAGFAKDVAQAASFYSTYAGGKAPGGSSAATPARSAGYGVYTHGWAPGWGG